MSIITTERLLLRDFVEVDWESVYTFLTDPEVTRYMHFASYSEADLWKWFTWCLDNSQQVHPDAYNWAIVLRVSNQGIGWFGIGSPSEPTRDGERDFGYALHRQYWGQGYMTEALQAVLNFEFEELGSTRIFATCEIENIASARVMEKAGMKYEGTFYHADFEGNWAHRHRYAIHDHEYMLERQVRLQNPED
jgi:ribosomal-protein-alanine N-acetyltransferase